MVIRSYKLALFIGLLLLLGAATVLAANAQVRSGWSEPQQLSTPGNKASEASLVSDQYGFVHVFWAEIEGETRSLLQYSRYDGGAWTKPVDLRVAGASNPIRSISAFVDDQGMLHLIWSTSQSGPYFYSTAPAHDALEAGKWSNPLLIGLEASRAEVAVDNQGTVHVIGADIQSEGSGGPGIYYLRSQDGGLSWTEGRWLDPDILADHYPASLQFAMDEDGGLHALWFYVSLVGDGADWIRYAHSLDGGETWSQPFTIFKNEENGTSINLSASPVLEVNDQTVHVIWGGGDQTGNLLFRHHRYSTDRGETWSQSRRFFDDLNGQAFDGLAVDGSGRVHYFAQLRYPQAIYHVYWENGSWSNPEVVYFISSGTSDPIDEETDVHAHHTHPAVRAGNELVLTFADSPPEPDRRLFMIHRTLDGITPASPEPTPTATGPTATATPAIIAEATETAVAGISDISPGNEVEPGEPMLMAVIPVLLLLGATVALQLIRSHRT